MKTVLGFQAEHFRFYNSNLIILISLKFDLVCDKALYGTISSSVVFAGSLIGSLVISTLSDKFGRKTVIFGAGCAVSIFSLMSAFPNVYWLYTVFRVIVGLGFGMYSYFGKLSFFLQPTEDECLSNRRNFKKRVLILMMKHCSFS